jgi:hypothetical protein
MINLTANNIKVLLNRRREYLKEYEKSYNEETFKYDIEEPKQIDEIKNEIIELIFKNESSLSVECIIETLTHLGCAPNILYDDNGHFAITDEGFQSICSGDEPDDVELSFKVEKKFWKDSIKEALDTYLENFDEKLWLDVHREHKLNRIVKKFY